MTDQADPNAELSDVTTLTEEERVALEERKAAKSWQYGQSGDRIDTTLGNLGGAGAAGSGPDIAQQSEPMPGNSSDEPGR